MNWNFQYHYLLIFILTVWTVSLQMLKGHALSLEFFGNLPYPNSVYFVPVVVKKTFEICNM